MINLIELNSDDVIEWKAYRAEKICTMFPFHEWHQIVADVDNDTDWENFLTEYDEFVKCFVLYRRKDNKPIAFAYILQEDEQGNIVSFHGGGWNKTILHTLLYYRGMIRLIETLLKNGFKVRTACTIENSTAYRFIKSAGFVNYRNNNTYKYFWINHKRLFNSKIYKKFNLL